MLLTKDNFDFLKRHKDHYAGTIANSLNPLNQTMEELQQVVHRKGGKDFSWMISSPKVLNHLGIEIPSFNEDFLRLPDYEGKEVYVLKDPGLLNGLLMGSGTLQDWFVDHNYINIVKINGYKSHEES